MLLVEIGDNGLNESPMPSAVYTAGRLCNQFVTRTWCRDD